MKLKNIKIRRFSSSAFLFKITSRCNDFCKFCIEYEFIKSKRPDLSLEEIKNNYLYLRARFKEDYVILTGGEPTLHPEFFKIIDFFKKRGVGFRMITNLLKFNEKAFLEKIKPFFTDFKSKNQENTTRIVASINDLPGRHPAAFKRFEGLKRALAAGLPLMVTVVIYKDNLKDLPDIALAVKKIFNKFAPDKILNMEFRLIYIEGTPPFLIKQSLPQGLNKIKTFLEKAITVLDSSDARVTLWNFPLCYLDNPEKIRNVGIDNKLERRFIKINKDSQMENAAVRNWETYFKSDKECRRCGYKDTCSGVDADYFKKYSFPKIKAR